MALRAHLLALLGEHFAVSPGYRRADDRLRARLRLAAPKLADLAEADLAWVAAGGPGDAARDEPWFETRWDGGESARAEADAARLAGDVEDIDLGGLLAGREVDVVVAPALRAEAFPIGPGRLLAGLDTPGVLVALAAIASWLPADALPRELDAADARDVALHVAGSALVVHAQLRSDALDALLVAATSALLPPQHQGDRLGGLVARLVALDALDQPPGEIERLTRGLQRRYSDRLHRAWQRGFFVPRGFDLAAFGESLRAP
ncbi:MAG: hypothetical protein H6745_24170 [Deltaproteobacteria bacterium]|nr:hypothetical protein [Deltaproteobacteria bacterium]